MTLQLVPADLVDRVWPQVAPLISRAMKINGDITLDQVRMSVVNRLLHLVVSVENEEINAAGTVEFISYPNKRVALLANLGGKKIVSPEAFEQIKQWCKGMGASELRAYAEEPQTRLYARVGMGKLSNVLGVPL